MSATDELRKFAGRWPSTDYICKDMLAIADRIDAEHESEISRAAQLLADAEKDRDFNYANWQDCKQKVLQHNITIGELDAEIERLMYERAHCIALPRDADGEPIHVGDRMTPNGMGTDFKVRQMHFNGKWSLDLEGFGISQTCPDMCHHHHAPTVEDTLREMLYKAHIYDEREMELLPDLIAEYAAKLQLKEDA